MPSFIDSSCYDAAMMTNDYFVPTHRPDVAEKDLIPLVEMVSSAVVSFYVAVVGLLGGFATVVRPTGGFGESKGCSF
jgi:hypothetical protein